MKTKRVKVSIIVPMYNVEKYIIRCLDSLKKQTLDDIEVILVNDGTKDKTAELCLDYIKSNQLNNKFYYYKKTNGGLSDARNFGLKYATGEYVCFLDSDDFVEPETYELLYNKAKSSNAILCECEFFYLYENGKKIVERLPQKYNSINDYMVHSSVVAWNKLINREWLKKTGIVFLKGYQFEDINFFFKNCIALNEIKKITTVNIPLINYVQRNDSITGKPNKRIREIVDIYSDVIEYAKKTNTYKQYESEIEYKVVRNLYCPFYRKLLKLDGKHNRKIIFDEFNNIIKTNFPKWKKNKYLKEFSFANVYLRLFSNYIRYILLYIL